MPVGLYMDHHVPRAITIALRLRNIDVLTAREDRAIEFEDAKLLDRATELGRVLFSQDVDFLAEAAHRQRESVPFAGVIYAHQLRLSLAKCIEDLTLLATVGSPEDFQDQVTFLPL